MRILFDEDTGGGVPAALRALGLSAVHVVELRKGMPDEQWLQIAGRGKFPVFSCNKAILEAEAQRQALIDEKVGAVFLTSGQERKLDVMRLVLNRLDWFLEIDQQERPFAYMVTIRGFWRRVALN